MSNRQVAEIERQLEELAARQKVLESLLEGYRALGELDDKRRGPVRDTTPKGSLSLRLAVRQVLTAARGEPLKPREIWDRAQRLGAASGAKSPTSVVDLISYQLQKTMPGLVKADGAWALAPEAPSVPAPEDGRNEAAL